MKKSRPRYFVDGYNLLFRNAAPPHTLQANRQRLIKDLNTLAHTQKLDLVVVFDAADLLDFEECTSYHSISVVFARSSADQWILHALQQWEGSAVLVTNDRKLSSQAITLHPDLTILSVNHLLPSKRKRKQACVKESPLFYRDTDLWLYWKTHFEKGFQEE